MLVLIGRRIVMVVAVVWAAATLNFFIPRIAPKNPIAEKLTQLAGTSGVDPTKIQEMSQAFGARFGLDQPLFTQYLRYIGDMARFDFGQSITKYPARVWDLIGEALPWTLGLMITTTLLAFLIGTLLGAAAGWYRNSALLSVISPIIMVFSAICGSRSAPAKSCTGAHQMSSASRMSSHCWVVFLMNPLARSRRTSSRPSMIWVSVTPS